MEVDKFQELVWQKGRELYRDMPWRDEPTFYHVLVSEIMLQQTQVSRVRTKFAEFMEQFPDVESLAAASLADVLRIWQGLGYNRRAKYLHEAARLIVAQKVPATLEELMKLPGIGKNTAAAIMNYTYQSPTAFVETNIRTVYLYHFFAHRTEVSDREVLELVERTLDDEHPRQWFWALMDYGAELKSKGFGRLDISKHYKKQSPLKGSVREVRGQIIAALTRDDLAEPDLKKSIDADSRYEIARDGLLADGLIVCSGGIFHLTK